MVWNCKNDFVKLVKTGNSWLIKTKKSIRSLAPCSEMVAIREAIRKVMLINGRIDNPTFLN